MDNNTLFPPNLQFLSDKVIRDVIQRDQQVRGCIITNTIRKTVVPSILQSSSVPSQGAPVETQRSAISHEVVNRNSLGSLALLNKTTSLTGYKRPLQEAMKEISTHSTAPKTRMAPITDEQDSSHTVNIELRRQRNRIHQTKYKMRQRKLVVGLEDAVKTLKDEIQELEFQHRVIFRIPTNMTAWGVPAEYFRLFRHGVKVPVSMTKASFSASVTGLCQFNAQREFLLAVMAKDVTDGVVFGVEALMERLAAWQSLCYHEMDLPPLCFKNGPGDSLIATTRCEFAITESTLHYAFPYLAPNTGKWSVVAEKMLGKKIVFLGSVHFVWNNACGRISRLHWKADILKALLSLFGNLEDVARVFENARLSPEGMHIL